jgi:TonB family protein
VTALLVVALLLAQGQATAPSPLPGNPTPPFPEAARREQVEGTIEFEADVDADGRVTAVRVLEVPKAGMGFEALAEKTLREWRFTPARSENGSVPGTYRGAIEMVFAFAAHRGRMYPKASFEAVWTAVEAAVGATGFETYSGDPSEGVLVTPQKSLHGGRLQLHVFVPRAARPLRVYVGSILDTDGSRRNTIRREFNLPEIGTRFFDALSTSLSERGVPVPQFFARRVQVAERAHGAGDPWLACLRRVLPNPPSPGDPRFQPATVISRAELEFTAVARAGDRPKEVVIEGEVAEDGVFVPHRVAEGARMEQSFVTMALGAASMWRFRPATIDGCPVPSTLKFTARLVPPSGR